MIYPDLKQRLQCLLCAVVLTLAACGPKDKVFDSDKTLSKQPASVIVIGAGLAGLNTALLLEENGFEVTVLEASKRIGGRIYTLDEVPGRPEAGGNTIGPNYARIIDRANRLGLALVPAPEIIDGGRAMQLYVDGQFIRPENWKDSSANPFPARVKQFAPGGMIFGALRNNPIKQPADWILPEFQKYDVPLEGLFDRMGLDSAAKSLVNQTNSYGDSLSTTSLLQMYRIGATYAASRSFEGGLKAISGGNQRLPEAMAKELNGAVHTNKIVVEITQTEYSVDVVTADGVRYSADHVVSSIPLTALRNIAITPALPEIQQQAIEQIDYSKTLIAQLSVSGNYWGDNSPSLWTNTPIERIFATSLDGSGQVSNLTLWISGDNSLKFSSMPADQRDAALLESLYGIYPAAQGNVKLEQVVDWNSNPRTKGVWAAFKPGQMTAFAAQMSTPSGRLHFAGEHTAIANTGMEGAMESSERVVAEILRGQTSPPQLLMACNACHSYQSGEPHKVGPNLHGFFGKPAASSLGYSYSPALKAAGFSWNKENLKQWLHAPESLVPGTKMIYHSQLSELELEQLVEYLAINSGK